MYDNIHTYYKDAKIFINELSAKTVIKLLIREEQKRPLSAEECAYMSKAYIFAQNDAMAKKYARLAIRADKNYPYGYIRLAFCYAREGKRRGTEKLARIADRFDLSNNSFLTSFLAVLYLYGGDNESFRQKVALLKNFPNKTPDYYYNFAFVYNSDDSVTALRYLKKAEEYGYKDNYNLWTNISDCYNTLEDYDNLEFYANKCLLCGYTPKMLGYKADCLNKRELYKDAVKYYKKQYKLLENVNEEKSIVLSKIIYNYHLEGDRRRCQRYIKFASRFFKPTEAMYRVIALCYEDEADYEKALEVSKKILKFNKKDASIYSSMSYYYSQKGKSEQAMVFVDKALELDPENSYSHYRKGRIYCSQNDYKLAIESFMKSVEYDKTDADAFQWISYCYSMLNEHEKSLEFANRAILLDKGDSYSYFRKAWAYQELGKYSEAIECYKECIKLNDKYVDAYLNISYIYSRMKDIKQSLLYANKALLINKDYAYAHYRKAWALQETGKFGEAFDGYSKAIELDPTDVYNYLGMACVSLNNNDSSEALEYANKALFVDRNCGGAYYYKSIALSNLGRPKEAEKAFAKALKLGYTSG